MEESFNMLYPFTKAVPEVGFIRVARMWIKVVFPAPFGPKRPKISLSWISMLTSSIAIKFLYFLKRFLISIKTAFCAISWFEET